MKTIMSGILGLMIFCLLFSFAQAGDEEHPTVQAQEKSSTYGMPLTQEEQRICNQNLSAVASNLSFTTETTAATPGQNVVQGSPPGIPPSISNDMKHLLYEAFHPEYTDFKVWKISEDSLSKLKTEGTPENRSYNKILQLADDNITKLNEVKDILSRYPGDESFPIQELLETIKAHADYQEWLKGFFAWIYGKNVNLEDNNDDSFWDTDVNLWQINKNWDIHSDQLRWTSIYLFPIHKTVPTDALKGHRLNRAIKVEPQQ